MSLDFAILGFLSIAPLSGYDLKKQFDSSVQHFWSADQSQIYRVLSRLNTSELVTQEIIEQNDRPDRKVYHITPKGRQALNEWLKSEVPFPPFRYGPMIQIFFGANLTDEEILGIFERHAFGIRRKLSMLEQGPEMLPPDLSEPTRSNYLRRLTLEASKRQAQTRLAFAEDVIQRIKNGELPPRD